MNTLNESCSRKETVLHVVSDIARELYYYVQWTGHFVCRKDFYIKRSNFDSYLLMYTVSGSGTLNYDGKKYRVFEKSVMLIDCNKPHEYFPDEGSEWEFKYIHFNGNKSTEYYKYIIKLFDSHIFASYGSTEYYFDEILRLTYESGTEETCSDYIYRILMKIIYSYKVTKDLDSSPGWLNQAVEYITQNYASDIPTEKIAEKFHFSRCHFSTLFKKYTGFSPHQYLANYRIAQAKMMLFNTSLSIDIISHKCGFQNTSSFIRAFKNQEGLSPQLFRKFNKSDSKNKKEG